MDNTQDVEDFADTLERVCIETVESGDMTRDLAINIGPDVEWLNTRQFFDRIVDRLNREMAS